MLVYGWGDKAKLLGMSSRRRCSRCGNLDHWVVYESKKQVKLYWIPVAQWNKRYVAQCQVCPNNDEMSEVEARRLVAEGEKSFYQGFMRAAAAILKAVAEVEGPGSPEWTQAREMLVGLADNSITYQQAEELLIDTSQDDLNASQFDEEQRLILLRVAIDVAVADGSINPAEYKALETLAAHLGIGTYVVKSLIDMLTNITDDGGSSAEFMDACATLRVGPDASIAEIRVVYRQLIMEHHPDRVPAAQQQEATQISARINAAYDLLIGRSGTGGQRSASQGHQSNRQRGSGPSVSAR